MARLFPNTFPALEWLEEASFGCPRVILAGGRRAMIENFTAIVEFTPSRIRLSTREGFLTVSGEELLLAQVRPDALTIRGRIREIELPRGG